MHSCMGNLLLNQAAGAMHLGHPYVSGAAHKHTMSVRNVRMNGNGDAEYTWGAHDYGQHDSRPEKDPFRSFTHFMTVLDIHS